MCGVPDGDEKNTAWRGMCNMIVANPDGINRDLFFFCYAVATWKAPPADLRHQFKKVKTNVSFPLTVNFIFFFLLLIKISDSARL